LRLPPLLAAPLGLALLALSGAAPAALFVPGVRPRAVRPGEGPVIERVDAVLNSHLVVKGVELLEVEGRRDIRLPLSGALRPGFPDLRVLSAALREKLLKLFDTRRFLKERFKPEDLPFTVAAPERLEGPSRAANVQVTFGGELAVVFGVARGETHGRVLYPSRPGPEGRREPLFEIRDPGLRRRVEDAVLERARAALVP